MKNLITFGIGGFGYCLIEILYRGYTHPSMLFAGGLCLVALSYISASSLSFFLKCILGGLTITSVEFIFGCIFNLMLGMEVWDYSDKSFNILGQVCPLFFLLWSLLSVGGFYLCRAISKRLCLG